MYQNAKIDPYYDPVGWTGSCTDNKG